MNTINEDKNYKSQPIAFSKLYTSNAHAEALETIHRFYRGGRIADKKSTRQYESVEALYSTNPFYFTILSRHFPLALVSLIQASVPSCTGSTKIDYSCIEDDVMQRVMRRIYDIEQLEVFDPELLKYFERTEQMSAYFKNGFSVYFARPLDEVTALFFGPTNPEELLISYGSVNPPKTIDHIKAAAELTTRYFGRGDICSFEDIELQTPALWTWINANQSKSAIDPVFVLSDADKEFFEAWAKSYPSKTYNRSSLSHSNNAGDARAYDLMKKYTEYCSNVLAELGIFEDSKTNAVYLLHFTALGRTYVKVGVTNYNYAFVRLKNLSNGFKRTIFKGIDPADMQLSDTSITDGKLMYLGSDNHGSLPRWVEDAFKETFPRADLEVVREDANFPVSELLDISGQEERFQAEVAAALKVSETVQKLSDSVYYSNFVENNYSQTIQTVAQMHFDLTN